MKNYKQVLVVASYKQQQYSDLLKNAKDAELLDKDWDSWNKSKNNLVSNMKNIGYECIEVPLDVNNLMNYCEKNRLENTGETRSHFALSIVNNNI